jgi:hypothetical protein
VASFSAAFLVPFALERLSGAQLIQEIGEAPSQRGVLPGQRWSPSWLRLIGLATHNVEPVRKVLVRARAAQYLLGDERPAPGR